MFFKNPTFIEVLDDNNADPQDGRKALPTVDINLSQWFLSVEMETPFNWQPRRFKDVSAEDVIASAKEKDEFDDSAFDKFVRLLTLIYEYTDQNKYYEAMKMILAAGRLIKQEKDAAGKKYEEFKHAMDHVLMATHAFVLATQGYETLSIKLYEEVVPISSMTEADLACIYAIKAKFFSLYRRKEGFQQAVESSRKALEHNPEEPMWMFILAESLRRKEEYFPSLNVPMEQLRLLHEAVEIDHNARYLVHLALRINNCVYVHNRNNADDREFYQEMIMNMQQKATDLYKEALLLDPEDEIVNRMCGCGLMKVSNKIAWENKHLIKSSLKKALSLSPTSSMTLHYLGKYYKKLEANEAKALDYFQRAIQSTANFPAHCDLIKLKFDLYGLKRYNPMQDFDIMLKQQEEISPYNKLISLSHIGSYYLFVRRDLHTALEYLIPVLEQDKDHIVTKYHRSLLLDKESIDLCEILANEIKRTEEDKLPNKYKLMKLIEDDPTYYLFKRVDDNLIDNLMHAFLRKLMHRQRKTPMKNDKSAVVLNWRLREENSDNSKGSNISRSNHQQRRFNNDRCKRPDSRKYSRDIDYECNWRLRDDSNNNREKNVFANWRSQKTNNRNKRNRTNLQNHHAGDSLM